MVQPSPLPLKNLPLPMLLNGRVAIVHKPYTLSEKLLSKLQEKGIHAQLIDEPIADCDVLIYLGGLASFSSLDQAIDCNAEAFKFTQAAAAHFSDHQSSLVLVEKLGGAYLNHPTQDNSFAFGFSGLAKTAHLECPNCSARIIDLDCDGLSESQMVNTLVDELLQGGDDQEVAIRGKERLTLTSNIEKVTLAPSVINNESVILVTGGARGITAQCLIELAGTVQPTFILFGRTPLQDEEESLSNLHDAKTLQAYFIEKAKGAGKIPQPKDIRREVANVLASREVKETIKALENKKCRVRYFNVDTRDETELAKDIAIIKQHYGKITGIIHAAGIISDKEIKLKKIEDFMNVFTTKITGITTLLKLTANEPLSLILFFSSVAARFGNVGQSDYAMANEILDRLAQDLHQKYPTRLIKSLDWAPWDAGMVTPELKEHFMKRGISLLPKEVGIQLFVRELMNSRPNDVEVILGPNEPLHPSADNTIKVADYQFLKSHRIKNQYVVPIALVIEWMFEVLVKQGLKQPITISNFTVLKGIKLQSPNESITLHANASPLPNNIYNIDIKDSEQHLCYKALGFSNPSSTPAFPRWEDTNQPWENTISDIYQHKLFHGEDLQVITQLKSINAHACLAELRGQQSFSWAKHHYQIDMALIDGALQIGILWGFYKINKPTLPISFDNITVYQFSKLPGNYQIFLREISTAPDEIVFDAFIKNSVDEIEMILKGVKMYPLLTGYNL